VSRPTLLIWRPPLSSSRPPHFPPLDSTNNWLIVPPNNHLIPLLRPNLLPPLHLTFLSVLSAWESILLVRKRRLLSWPLSSNVLVNVDFVSIVKEEVTVISASATRLDRKGKRDASMSLSVSSPWTAIKRLRKDSVDIFGSAVGVESLVLVLLLALALSVEGVGSTLGVVVGIRGNWRAALVEHRDDEIRGDRFQIVDV
jgi:hypothetical protein